MTFDIETYDLIDRHLKGLLSDEEKALFEKRQNENPAFAEEVKLQKLINDLVLEKGLADIRTKVGADLANAKGGSWFKTAILFTGAFCIVAGGVMYYSSKQKTNLNSIVLQEVQRKGHEQSTPFVAPLKEVQENNNAFKRNIGSAKQDTSGSMQTNIRVEIKDRNIQQISVVEDTIKTLTNSPKENKVTRTEPLSKQEPCDNIIFEVKSEPSCFQKQTGKIQILISSIKGGSKPYTYSIGGDDFSLASISQSLGQGDYQVLVKDNKGCISEKQILIDEKPCIEFADYSFNPLLETWKFPLKESESGTITIADVSGRIIYSSKVTPSDSWNGKTLNGDTQESGSYLYIIESNGIKIKQGYITIFY